MGAIRNFIKARLPKGMVRVLRSASIRLAPRRTVSLPVFGAALPYARHPIYRGEYFPAHRPHAWLDLPDWEDAIRRKVDCGEITAAAAEACRQFALEGYFIAPRLIPEKTVSGAFDAYHAALAAGRIVREPGDQRFLNPHVSVSEVDALFRHPAILQYNDLFLGGRATPFQTIGSHFGSQQKAHSDAIHMTTYPLGYMTAAWIACEDVHADSGPLFYYPRSHRLPYSLSREAGIAPLEFLEGGEYAVYRGKYEPFIEEQVRREGLQPLHFLASKGDVLFWHHNLIHGGSSIRDPSRSRKAFVCHYFRREAICYHDLSGRIARFD